MKYYLHDSNAFNDEKITQLYIKFGYEGLGLFYTALEKFSAQEKPINTEVLKKQLNIGKRLNKCWLFMEQIGIICSSNGESFNKELLKFSEKYQIKKEKNSKRIAEWRSRHENVTCYERVSNTPKDKISKVNRNKENNMSVFFEELWKEYPKPVGRKDALRHFTSSVKTASDLDSLRVALKNYKNSLSVKNGFIQNGSTWFNNWRDWVNYVEKEAPKKQDKPVQHIPSANTTLEMMEQWKKEC